MDKMKVQNLWLLISDDVVKSIAAVTSLNLPSRTSYALLQCSDCLSVQHQTIMTLKTKILKSLGKQGKTEGNLVSFEIPKENVEAYNKELNDLGSLEFELPVSAKVKINVNKIQNEEISAKDMKLTSFYIDWVEE